MTNYICFSCGKETIDNCNGKCEHACKHCGMKNIYDTEVLIRLKREGKVYLPQ